MQRLFIIVGLILCLLQGQAVYAENEKATVKIALIDSFSPDFYLDTFVPTVEYLIRELPQYRFEVKELNPEFLKTQIAEASPDFLIASASSYVSLIDSRGAQQIVTKKRETAGSVDASVGSVFIVRSDRKDIRSLQDLKEKSVAATSPVDFDGWLIAMDELSQNGIDPDNCFGNKIFTHYNYPDPATYVKVGMAEAAVLPVCEFESMVSTGQLKAEDFKVIGSKGDASEKCVRSTDLFPDVVFSSMPSASPEMVKAVSLAMLSIPASKQFEWLPSNSFLRVFELQKDLKIGHYEYLRDKTINAFLQEYRQELYLLLALAVAVLIHIIRVNRLVRLRTEELNHAIAEQRKIERAEQDNLRKLEILEKNQAVTQMCSMFAHEVKQPITNIMYYTSGLKILLDRLNVRNNHIDEVLGKLHDQARKTADIVEHVRGYAKRERHRTQYTDLAVILKNALKNIPESSRNRISVDYDEHASYGVNADPFEIELVMLNLIKNALSASAVSGTPKVEIGIEEKDDQMIFTISNNGEVLTEETFSQLGKPVRSVKKDGLGVGLSIAYSIIESHAGHMTFKHHPEGGLTVSFYLKRADHAS